MPQPSRRDFLHCSAAGLLSAMLPGGRAKAVPPARATCTLSIGTYSMKGVALENAIASIAAAGYDGIEIAVQPGFEGEPKLLSTTRRKEVGRLLVDRKLQLTALMEHLAPAAESALHQADLDRLRQAMQLAHELSPQSPPLIQTVLGSGEWEEKKNLFRDRLGDWQRMAVAEEITLCVKPHRGGAMSRPSEAAWLIEQLGNSPGLRMVYDYSHYAFRDLPLEETVRTALPVTAHIAVKDAVQQEGRVAFVLPGESGTFDYAKLLRLFHDGGYRGDICCEVSSMVSTRPGYDPQAAIKTCYANMARAFEKSGVPRTRAS